MYDSFDAFLRMGGYGAYIWPSYTICFGLIIALTVQSVLSWRRRQSELDMLRASRARREDQSPPAPNAPEASEETAA